MTITNSFMRIFIILLSPLVMHGIVSNYNHFPTYQPSHILDEKRTNISFAFSMRVLVSEYNGPLIRLRRASDNAQQDFSRGDNDIVDVTAINTWRNGSNVYVHTWYDQSGLGRNAVQTNPTRQPRFYPDATIPYFQGDGSNDHLTVDTPNGIQDVTNAGKEGSVLALMRATKKNQHTFGVLDNTASPSNRWSAHLNWGNSRAYFDPGHCCVPNRSFYNITNENKWRYYSFIKKTSTIIMRVNGIDKLNGTHTASACTRTEDFAIGWATGNETGNHSSTSFTEFIMYKIDIPSSEYQEIEDNAMTFWGL